MVFTKSLKQNHLFQRLYKKGKSAAGRYVAVYCRKNGLDYNRLGLTAGKKLGHAVDRNRVRRRIREAYRLREPELARGYDIVVVARSRAIDGEYSQIADCLYSQLEKLGILGKESCHEETPAVADPTVSE